MKVRSKIHLFFQPHFEDKKTIFVSKDGFKDFQLLWKEFWFFWRWTTHFFFKGDNLFERIK